MSRGKTASFLLSRGKTEVQDDPLVLSTLHEFLELLSTILADLSLDMDSSTASIVES